MTRAGVICICLFAFGSGAAAVLLLNRSEPVTLSAMPAAPDAHEAQALLARLEEIDRRLANIESSLPTQSFGKTDVSPAPPIPTRTNDKTLEEIRAEVESLRDEMRGRLAGLGELQALKPEPDLKALDDLRARCGKDQGLVKASFLGMTYRDVVFQLGSPSVKYPALTGPNVYHPETWVWESSNGDLAIAFVHSSVSEASLHPSGVMRKFLDDLKAR